MQHLLGWEPIIENGNIIGLFDVTSGGAVVFSTGAKEQPAVATGPSE
jgi:glutamate--cysteine ligase